MVAEHVAGATNFRVEAAMAVYFAIEDERVATGFIDPWLSTAIRFHDAQAIVAQRQMLTCPGSLLIRAAVRDAGKHGGQSAAHVGEPVCAPGGKAD
jgi:hypothetical protein